MIYWVGDGANLRLFPALDRFIKTQLENLAQVASNDVVAAAYQLDGTTGATVRRVMLGPDHPRAPEFTQVIEETNAGDPQELVDFFQWAAAAAPGNVAVLALSGHGLAWQDRRAAELLQTRGVRTAGTPSDPNFLIAPRRLFGKRRYDKLLIARRQQLIAITRGPGGAKLAAALDTRGVLIDGSSSDFLSTHELANAMLGCASALGRRIDVLVCDACLMSAVEILTAVAPHVSQFVGAVDELVGSGLNYAGSVSKCTGFARAGATLTPAAVAKSFVQSFLPSSSFDSCLAVDLQGASWTAAQNAFKGFVASMLEWFANSPSAYRPVLAGQFCGALQKAPELTRFGNSIAIPESSTADLGALATALEQQLSEMPATVREGLRVAKGLYTGAVTAKSVGADYTAESFVGISIYVPRSQHELNYNQSDYAALEFSKTTQWGRLLDVAYLLKPAARA